MSELSASEWLGVLSFIVHLVAYAWYAHGIFHERIRPNAAAWFMWFVGNVIELLTYDAILGSHWSTSALPFACVIGVGLIFLATLLSQMRQHTNATGKVVYHVPERGDYFLVLFDLGAGMLWVTKGWAGIANMIAVATSALSFFPIWRTTYTHYHEEHLGPWILWSLAYVAMFAAVVLEGGESFVVRSFYPLYYFILHIVVVLLFFRPFREAVSSLRKHLFGSV